MADRRFKNIVEYVLFQAFAGFIRALPRAWALALGAGLGRLSRHLLGKRRRTALDNLQRAFPGDGRSGTGRGPWSASFAISASAAWRCCSSTASAIPATWNAISAFAGLENLREAFALGRGVLLLTGHSVSGRSAAVFLPSLGFPADFVAKRMKNPYIDRYFQRMREAAGVPGPRRQARRPPDSRPWPRSGRWRCSSTSTPPRTARSRSPSSAARPRPRRSSPRSP